jgi:hypothetical protein
MAELRARREAMWAEIRAKREAQEARIAVTLAPRANSLRAQVVADHDRWASDPHFQKLTGPPFAEWPPEQREKEITRRAISSVISGAIKRADWCARCGVDLPHDQPVWFSKMRRYKALSTVPMCQQCATETPLSHRRAYPPEWEDQPCENCGRTVMERRWLRHYVCSEQCRWQAANQHRRASHTDRTCDQCGTTYTPTRSDAHYCTPACRQAAHRARHHGDPDAP